MATDKPRFLVSRSYEIVTDESARIGDAAERGYEFQDVPMSLEETLAELRDCEFLSSNPIRSHRDLDGSEWAYTEPSADYATGEERTESVHIQPIRKPHMAPVQLYRLFCLAGLIAH